MSGAGAVLPRIMMARLIGPVRESHAFLLLWSLAMIVGTFGAEPVSAQQSPDTVVQTGREGPLCRDAMAEAPAASNVPQSVPDNAEAIIEYHRAQALERNADDPTRAMAHACLYLIRAEDSGLAVRAADAERLIAGLLWLRGETKPALAWIEEASEGYAAVGDIAKVATAANLRGAINLDAGSFSAALEDFRTALREAERSGAIEERLQALGNIGVVYSDLDDHDSALMYMRRALDLQEQQELGFDAAMTRMNIGRALGELDRPGEAVPELSRSIMALSAQMESAGEGGEGAVAATALPRVLLSRAGIFLDLDRPNDALSDLRRVEALVSADANRPEMIAMYASRARAFAALGDNRAAAEQISMAKSLGEPDSPLVALTLASTEAEVAAALGRYDEAYAASQRESDLRDQLREADMLKAAARAQVEMGVEDLRRQSLLDEERAENAELRLEGQQRGLLAAIIGIALLLALVGALGVAMRNRKIAARALENNLKVRETLLDEIHHRTKNNLQLLSSMIRLGAQQQEGGIAAKDAVNRARTMALVHDHLYVGSARQSDTVDARDFFGQLIELLDNSIGRPNIALSHDVDAVKLRGDQVTVLGLLASEMITNSYKHAFDDRGGTIAMHLREEDGKLALRVIDDGGGFEPKSGGRPGSIGMQLIEDLAIQAGGELAIDSTSEGTTLAVNDIPIELPAEATV